MRYFLDFFRIFYVFVTIMSCSWNMNDFSRVKIIFINTKTIRSDRVACQVVREKRQKYLHQTHDCRDQSNR